MGRLKCRGDWDEIIGYVSHQSSAAAAEIIFFLRDTITRDMLFWGRFIIRNHHLSIGGQLKNVLFETLGWKEGVGGDYWKKFFFLGRWDKPALLLEVRRRREREAEKMAAFWYLCVCGYVGIWVCAMLVQRQARRKVMHRHQVHSFLFRCRLNGLVAICMWVGCCMSLFQEVCWWWWRWWGGGSMRHGINDYNDPRTGWMRACVMYETYERTVYNDPRLLTVVQLILPLLLASRSSAWEYHCRVIQHSFIQCSTILSID